MMKVKTIKLNSGTLIPAIGFGTAQVMHNSAQVVEQALKTGYRLLDTAKLYGNEVGVGEGIRISGINRADIFVTTKLWTSDQGFNQTHKAFDDSLGKLGLDYVDLYLIHWPGYSANLRRESWRAMQEIFHSGRAKAIGVSNYMVEHLDELLAYAKIPPAVNQIEFNPFIYKQQQPVLEMCRQQGSVVEAYSPLAKGEINNEVIRTVANEHQATPAQVMLAWAMAHDTVPIPKSAMVEHMKANLESIHVKLTSEDVKRLDNIV